MGSACVPLASTTSFLPVEAADILRAHHAAVGNAQLAQAVRDFDIVDHASADDADLAPHHARNVDHLLDAVNRAGKARDHHAFRGGAEKLFEPHHHRSLGRRKTGPLHVGAVAEERQNPFRSVARESMQVERLAIHRRGVDFEVPGVNDHAHGRSHRQRDAVDGAVSDSQIFDLEGAQSGGVAGRDFVQFGRIEQPVLFELLANQGHRKLRAVNGHVEVAQNVGDRADVILVRVREDDRAHHALVLFQIGNVGDHDIHAEQLLLGEHQARIDHDNVVARAEGEHVHSELAQSAERNGPQRRCAQMFFLGFSLSLRKERSTILTRPG